MLLVRTTGRRARLRALHAALPCLAAATVVATLAIAPREAEARSVIKQPNAHPDYRAELEPHGTAVIFHRGYHGRARYRGVGDPEVGVGFRATIELGDPAFIPKINNTVGITFGVDVTNCYRRGYCGREDFLIWNPIGMQWNFFLTEKWSVFGEIGGVLRSEGFYADLYPDLMFEAGGRYHFSDSVSLTMRVGWPFATIGVSFFVGG